MPKSKSTKLPLSRGNSCCECHHPYLWALIFMCVMLAFYVKTTAENKDLEERVIKQEAEAKYTEVVITDSYKSYSNKDIKVSTTPPVGTVIKNTEKGFTLKLPKSEDSLMVTVSGMESDDKKCAAKLNAGLTLSEKVGSYNYMSMAPTSKASNGMNWNIKEYSTVANGTCYHMTLMSSVPEQNPTAAMKNTQTQNMNTLISLAKSLKFENWEPNTKK